MKPFKPFGFTRSNYLTWDLFFFTTAIALLVQMNSAQTAILHLQSQSLTLQASKPGSTDQSGWLIFAGLAGLAGVVGLATLKHKRGNAIRQTSDSQDDIADEETYFG